MIDYVKKYPGTVVGQISKDDLLFEEKFKNVLKSVLEWKNRSVTKRIAEKIKIYGNAVSCCDDTGYIAEGNIVDWNDDFAIILDHETKELSNWEYKYITFIGNKET